MQIDSNEVYTSKEFMDVVLGAVLKLYGEYGASNAILTLIDYDMEKKFAIIRTLNKTVNMVRASIASIMMICKKPAAIHILAVSGTIKALHKKFKY